MAGEWVDAQADRCFDRQRSQVETAKLVATFAAGAAGAVVATALQVEPVTDRDRWGIWLFGASAVLAVFVMILDRIAEADHRFIASLYSGNNAVIQDKIRDATLLTLDWNDTVVGDVRRALALQLAVSVAAGWFAAVSLIG